MNYYLGCDIGTTGTCDFPNTNHVVPVEIKRALLFAVGKLANLINR